MYNTIVRYVFIKGKPDNIINDGYKKNFDITLEKPKEIVMKRVFHVDQECFVIFLEDFSNTKDRFLRIGNSPFLKKLEENITFVTLLTKLVPGDEKIELQIFKPKQEKEIVGLKNVLTDFVNFLENNGIKTDSIKKIEAENQSKIVATHKTEEEFLREIKKNMRLENHSFASFYNDGNIRVFNKKNVIFDLKKRLGEYQHELKEVNSVSNFYKAKYKDSYDKTGIIHSNNSLFVFSDSHFACLTNSEDWLHDAFMVGIDPEDVDIFYASTNFSLNSHYHKVLLDRAEKEKKTDIIFSKKNDLWDILYVNKYINQSPIEDRELKLRLNKMDMTFNLNSIKIASGDINLELKVDSNFSNSEYSFSGKFKEKDFKLNVDDFKKETLTLYSYSPLVFNDKFEGNEYVIDFWNDFPEKIKLDFMKNIHEDDKYDNFSLPFKKTSNFYNKLYIETVRRIAFEGDKKVNSMNFTDIVGLLKNFNGSQIIKNNILIEQSLGLDVKRQRVSIRDKLISRNSYFIEDEINPFLIFQKEAESGELNDKLLRYRESHKKDLEQKIAGRVDARFMEIERNRKFYNEEQERLIRFMSKIITDERKDFERNIDVKTSNEKIKEFYETTKVSMDKSGDEPDKKEEKSEEKSAQKSEKTKRILRISIFSLLGLLLIGLILLGIIYGPGLYKKLKDEFFISSTNDNSNRINKNNKTNEDMNKNQQLTQNEYIKKTYDKYNTINKEKRLKSKHYNFYATIYDIWALTNVIAEKNNYHRINYYYYEKNRKNLEGKDPDWIYPGNTLTLPDNSRIVIKKGDVMWDISEKFIIDHINKDELRIRDLIERVKLKKIKIEDARDEMRKIKLESYSEMIKDFLSTLIKLESFKNWEPYIDENKK